MRGRGALAPITQQLFCFLSRPAWFGLSSLFFQLNSKDGSANKLNHPFYEGSAFLSRGPIPFQQTSFAFISAPLGNELVDEEKRSELSESIKRKQLNSINKDNSLRLLVFSFKDNKEEQPSWNEKKVYFLGVEWWGARGPPAITQNKLNFLSRCFISSINWIARSLIAFTTCCSSNSISLIQLIGFHSIIKDKKIL